MASRAATGPAEVGPTPSASGVPTPRAGAAARRERGTTVVTDRVVRRVAERAAAEAVPDGEPARRVRLQRRGRTVRLALEVRLGHPGLLPLEGELIRRHVTDRTEELTGLVVPRTRVEISHLRVAPGGGRLARPVSLTKDRDPASSGSDAGALPQEDRNAATAARPAPGAPLPHRTRRPWASRRVPTGALAAVGAVLTGAVLADVISVRAGNEPSSWRSSATERLTGLQFGDSWLPWAGAGPTVLGLCLLLLALAPGRRSLLPLRTPERALDAVLDRSSTTLLVRDAVLASPGVTGCDTRVGRRRVRVRARVGFGELHAVRDALDAEVRRVVESLVLSRQPRVSVTVAPDELWRAPEPDLPRSVEGTTASGATAGGDEAPLSDRQTAAVAPSDPGPSDPGTPAGPPPSPEPGAAAGGSAHGGADRDTEPGSEANVS